MTAETLEMTLPATRIRVQVAWLCGIVMMLEGYDLASLGYAIPSLVDAWRVAPSVFTPVATAGNVGLMLGSLGASSLGDGVGRKPVLTGSVAIFGVASLLCAFAHSPWQLEVLRVLTGLGLGGGLPAASALASDFAPQTQGRLVILVFLGIPLGFSAGGWWASWLVRAFGWPGIFMSGGLLPLAILPLLVLWLPESLVVQKEKRRGRVATLFEDRRALQTALLWSINGLNYLGIYFVLLWMPAILHLAGASASRAVQGTTMYGIGSIVGILVTAVLVKRLPLESVLARVLVFGAVCVLAVGLLNPRFALLSLLLCGVGIGSGCQAGINTISALSYPSTIRSLGAGWAMGAGRIGTIAGPLLGGLLLGFGLQPQEIFILLSIPAFGTAVLMVFLGRTFAGTRERRS